MGLIKDKISGAVKTSKDKVPSQFLESAGFAYLAYLKKGELFLSK